MDGFWPTFIRRKPTPPPYAEKTSGRPTATFTSPQTAIILLQGTPQTPYKCLVKRGEEVVTGQKIGVMGNSPFQIAVHATISGKVRETDFHPTPHGFEVFCAVVDSSGKEEDCLPISSGDGRDNGIGMFLEAGIPLDYEKLSGGKIEALLVNATEFEPFITVHHQLIREKAPQMLDGLKVLMRAFSIPEAVICLEKNQTLLIQALKKAGKEWQNLTIKPVAKSYPATAEKVLMAETVRKGNSPEKSRMCLADLALLLAVEKAANEKVPFIERMITVAGSGVAHPQNIRVRIGTPFNEVIVRCGGNVDKLTQIIMGGPLMGIAQFSSQVPVTQTTTGILTLVAFALAEGHQSRMYEEGPCVRCAKCVDCCPVSILPNIIAAYCQKRRFREARENGLFVCIDCGLCSYVCPARIPLTQIFKETKSREELFPQEDES